MGEEIRVYGKWRDKIWNIIRAGARTCVIFYVVVLIQRDVMRDLVLHVNYVKLGRDSLEFAETGLTNRHEAFDHVLHTPVDLLGFRGAVFADRDTLV